MMGGGGEIILLEHLLLFRNVRCNIRNLIIEWISFFVVKIFEGYYCSLSNYEGHVFIKINDPSPGYNYSIAKLCYVHITQMTNHDNKNGLHFFI